MLGKSTNITVLVTISCVLLCSLILCSAETDIPNAQESFSRLYRSERAGDATLQEAEKQPVASDKAEKQPVISGKAEKQQIVPDKHKEEKQPVVPDNHKAEKQSVTSDKPAAHKKTVSPPTSVPHANNATVADSVGEHTVGRPQRNLNSGALLRGFSVFVGLSAIVVIYIVIRAISMRRKKTTIRKYGILTNREDVEMTPLGAEDDEEDTTLFDVSNQTRP